MNPDDDLGPLFSYQLDPILVSMHDRTRQAYERRGGYERRPEYSRGGYTGPPKAAAINPGLMQSFSSLAQNLSNSFADISSASHEAMNAVLKACMSRPGISWSDEGTPGSPYAVIKNTNNIKKESGVSLRESITPDENLTRPKPCKTICLQHGQKFHLRRDDMSWGCPECDKGRVAFNKWYRDTYSLGYLRVHKFVGSKHSDLPQEVVLTADESFKAVAIMIQRAEPGVDAPVFVTDLGDIAVDTALKVEPDEESGVRTITLPSLYGLSPQVLTDDEDDDEGSTIYDA